MAAAAVLGDRVIHAARGMTTYAIGAGMRTVQCKPGFPGVIKFCSGPADCGMALIAGGAARRPVHIIRCVARHTLHRCVLVAIPRMTG